MVKKLLESDQLYHGLAPIYVAPETGLMSGDSWFHNDFLRHPCFCPPVGPEISPAYGNARP